MKIIGFLVSLLFFVGGFYLMGVAFTVVGLESVVFMTGILSSSLGLFIPAHILKRVDG